MINIIDKGDILFEYVPSKDPTKNFVIKIIAEQDIDEVSRFITEVQKKKNPILVGFKFNDEVYLDYIKRFIKNILPT